MEVVYFERFGERGTRSLSTRRHLHVYRDDCHSVYRDGLSGQEVYWYYRFKMLQSNVLKDVTNISFEDYFRTLSNRLSKIMIL